MKYIETVKSLKNQIVDEKDRILFDEIITCYESGALRAAYIMSWISILESLKQKLNKMAIKDSQVEKFVAKIKEKEEKGEYISDKRILEKSKEYGLLSFIEYDMRN